MNEEQLVIWRATYASAFAEMFLKRKGSIESTEWAIHAANAAVLGLAEWREKENPLVGVVKP